MCNSNALNAIYNAIDVGQFRMISSYKTAKEVLEALETTYEGPSKVLTSLPDKFSPKKTAMTQSNDVTKMKLEEHIGSLQTNMMEMRMQDQNRDLTERARTLAFLSTERKSDDENENEVMLAKKIGRYMKKLELLKDKKLSKSN
ncbi:unnamed protein product [Arabidopsis halleri]